MNPIHLFQVEFQWKRQRPQLVHALWLYGTFILFQSTYVHKKFPVKENNWKVILYIWKTKWLQVTYFQAATGAKI